jgi:hypothetical protein
MNERREMVSHATTSTPGLSIDDQKLQQYGILMSYLQYENAVYWERANFFLVASVAFFSFVVTNLPPLRPQTPWEQVLIFLVASLTGLCLSYLWWRGLQIGEFWIDHWHSLLRQLEPDAFGELKVLGGFKQREGGPLFNDNYNYPLMTIRNAH